MDLAAWSPAVTGGQGAYRSAEREPVQPAHAPQGSPARSRRIAVLRNMRSLLVLYFRSVIGQKNAERNSTERYFGNNSPT